MGKKAPDPTPPRQVIATQTGSNVHTGIANAYLNNVSRYGPDGKIEIRKSGTQRIYDPERGKSFSIPTFSQHITLSDEQKAIKEQRDAARLNLAKLGVKQTERMDSLLREEITQDTLPPFGDINALPQIGLMRIADGPKLEQLEKQDFSKDREKVEKALLERLRPQQELDRNRLESRLAAQGIRIGSDAYKHAMAQYGDRVNDARLGALLAAGEEQERLARLAEERALFRNNVQQRAFANEMQKAKMNNLAILKEFGAGLTRAEAKNAHRKNVLEEKFAVRNAPLNKIIALLHGSQVKMPQFSPIRMGTIAPVDVAGIYANYDRGRRQAAEVNADISKNLFEQYLESDRRLKKEIAPVGRTNDGQTIYRFRYKVGGPIRMGLMADEVGKKHPDAVRMVGGMKLVNYQKALERAVRKKKRR